MVKRFITSFGYAFKGLMFAWKGQTNIKVQFVIALVVIFASVYFRITTVEWCIVLFAIALVISLELMNSAIEHAVNLVTKEFHPIAGKAKDIAAAAVLWASIFASIIGFIIFKDYLRSII